MKPTYRWIERDYGNCWDCTMQLPLSSIGISGDGFLQGNEERIACWQYRVHGTPCAEQRRYVEETLYQQYLASLKPKPKKPKKPVPKPKPSLVLLLCTQ